jgi:hypothetical protein
VSDPREERLPKWAQEELQSLRRKVLDAQLLNEELRGEVGQTNTFVLNYGDGTNQPLPNNARVEFRWPSKRWDEHIQVYIEGDRLHIQGGRFLVIHPQVSNAFDIALGNG